MLISTNALLAAVAASVFGSADMRSSNISRGSVVNPEPIQSLTVGAEAEAWGNTLGARAWMCNHLTDARDNMMRRAFNEIDPYLYGRNRVEVVKDWSVVSEFGPCWVLAPEFRDPYRSHTEVEWRVRQALENPFLTPYYYVRWCVHPTVLPYWMAGVQHEFDPADDVSLVPFVQTDWGSDSMFVAKYGKPPDGRYGGGLSALTAGVRMVWRFHENYSLYAQAEEFALVNEEIRRCNRRRAAVNNQNERFVVTVGIAFRF